MIGVQEHGRIETEVFVQKVRAWVVEQLNVAEVRPTPFAGHPCTPVVLIRRLHDAGGKGFRPAMVATGLQLGNGPAPNDVMRAVRVAGAIELMHLFGLIQDDIVDGASTRRGASSAHTYGARVLGDSDERTAEGLAVLAADLSLAIADQSIADEDSHVLELWHEMKLQMIFGQVGDVLASFADHQVDDEDLRLISLMKSGRYSVALPLRMGVRLVDPALDDARLRNAADRLGLLFQAIDDLRDLQPSHLSGKDQLLDMANTKRRYSDTLDLDAYSTESIHAYVDRELCDIDDILAETDLHSPTRRALEASFRSLAAGALDGRA